MKKTIYIVAAILIPGGIILGLLYFLKTRNSSLTGGSGGLLGTSGGSGGGSGGGGSSVSINPGSGGGILSFLGLGGSGGGVNGFVNGANSITTLAGNVAKILSPVVSTVNGWFSSGSNGGASSILSSLGGSPNLSEIDSLGSSSLNFGPPAGTGNVNDYVGQNDYSSNLGSRISAIFNSFVPVNGGGNAAQPDTSVPFTASFAGSPVGNSTNVFNNFATDFGSTSGNSPGLYYGVGGVPTASNESTSSTPFNDLFSSAPSFSNSNDYFGNISTIGL